MPAGTMLAVHPGGDNLILGAYDRKLAWFDMDLSTSPCVTLRHISFIFSTTFLSCS